MIATHETKCGPLWISGDKEAVDRISWRPIEGVVHLGELDWVLSPLDEYFRGSLSSFPGSLLFTETGTMWTRKPHQLRIFLNSQKILAAISEIPYGKTVAYSEIAASIGRPGAARAVGSVCRTNPIPIIIPCHRVVARSSLGGYTPDIRIKEFLLKHEGSLIPFCIQDDTAESRKRRRRCTFSVLRGADDADDKGAA